MRKTYESNLFVKNIPSEISEEEIVGKFEEIGPVISIKLRQGKYFNPQAAYRQYFILFKDIDCAKRAIQLFDQSTPFGARPLSVQFWMPTQELHQEREQRSFQEVQQYFMRTIYANQGGQFGPGGMQQMGGQGQHGGRPHGGY
jgi:RNA recognition motif-containing protein|mmetsp:Transcript_13079/g.17688  ORF Transcript_13079/g.17688 Transcript_13079/m.17688 type:complete len:143 (+) Transcript_13079:1093-1521(+)